MNTYKTVVSVETARINASGEMEPLDYDLATEVSKKIESLWGDGYIVTNPNAGGGAGDGGDYHSISQIIEYRLPTVEVFKSDASGKLYYHNIDNGFVTETMPRMGLIATIGYGDPHGSGLHTPVGNVYVARVGRNKGDVLIQTIPHDVLKTIGVWASGDLAQEIADDIKENLDRTHFTLAYRVGLLFPGMELNDDHLIGYFFSIDEAIKESEDEALKHSREFSWETFKSPSLNNFGLSWYEKRLNGTNFQISVYPVAIQGEPA